MGSILEPGRPPKTDKAAVLIDAVRMVNQLRGEAQKLKDSNSSLQEKIKELKVTLCFYLFYVFILYIWNFRTIACQKLHSEFAFLLSLCRQRRLNFVMRSRGWSQRKRSWSSNWRPWLHSLASCLPLLQFLPHLLLKAKLMATRWCLSLVTLGSPCGSSCHLLQLIHPRIMYSAPQLLKSATGIQYRRFGISLYPKQVYYLVIVLVLVLCLVLSSFVTV